jgi:hypothetical protein
MLKKYLVFCGFILIFVCNQLFSIEKRVAPLSHKTSVIIPCHYKHAQHLPGLLQAFSEQTLIPDEVVISLSERNKVPKHIIDSINTTSYPFSLCLISFEEPVSDGGNRNYACAHATGDLLICHDADDIPLPQRVEIIKYFFDVYQIDHLMHRWCGETDHQPFFKDFEKIGRFHLPEYRDYPLHAGGRFTNGHVSISRQLFGVIRWDTAFRLGVDVDFNRKAYALFPNTTIVLEEPLSVYRQRFSTF